MSHKINARTKWDRSLCRKERIVWVESEDYGTWCTRCDWHKDGVDVYAQGGNWRKPGCPVCDAKLARGEVTADAPPPEKFLEDWLKRKRDLRWVDWDRRSKQQKARRKFYAEMVMPEKAGLA